MNVKKIRSDFPTLLEKKAPVYFDNACTTFRPIQVIKKMNEYYELYPSCAGKSNHRLGTAVTEEVLKSRMIAASFFNAKRDNEIIFTRNTTEGINLVANSFDWKKGDKILISDKEHNSNLVPWQIAKLKGLRYDIFRFGDLEDFRSKVRGAKLVSIVHTSNVDGTSNPVREMIKIAHENGALVMLDAAQSAPHKEIDVRKLDVDFLACSGHKMLGPSGMGILYGKQELLEKLRQFMVGGETVTNTTYSSFTPEKVPERFEAGLQNYSGIVGLGEALKYLDRAGLKNIEEHETMLNQRLTKGLLDLGVDILGPNDAALRSGIVSFNVGKMSPHEVSLLMNNYGVMMRSGMHCVHSWFNAQRLKGSARASLYLYNTPEEVDFMIEKMRDVVRLAG